MYCIFQKKCEQYWPDKVGETLDVQNGLVVLLNSFVPFADYIIRDLKVTKVGKTIYKKKIILNLIFLIYL